PDEIKNNMSLIIFDTMGIFWTMKYPNQKDEALLEEFKDDILRLLEIRQMLLVTRFGTSNIRETIVLRVNELLQIELADPAVSWIRAREIYDFELSTYETRKAAIKVLLRLLPN
ncbi:MAG: hypothetical protein UU81_C0009G0026, partial [Microgenomates group bacterium GW2011_GWC1_41_8]